MMDQNASQHPDVQPPEQQSNRPGNQNTMQQQPQTAPLHPGSGRLQDKVAVVTGGDSGIGRAVAVTFAREGSDVVISCLNEERDANETKRLVEAEGRRAVVVMGDIGNEAHCQEIIRTTVDQFGKLDILVNNAAEQHPQDSITDISTEQLERTFRTNIFSMFYLVKAALPQLKQGSSIINTTSVTAYKGHPQLLDYSATKGAILAFTRSLSQALASKGIRVNAVAPGPIWTPLIVSTFPPDKIQSFGKDVPLKRAGQPNEVAPSYVFLASDDASYITGQTLHPNGGTVVNS